MPSRYTGNRMPTAGAPVVPRGARGVTGLPPVVSEHGLKPEPYLFGYESDMRINGVVATIRISYNRKGI